MAATTDHRQLAPKTARTVTEVVDHDATATLTLSKLGWLYFSWGFLPHLASLEIRDFEEDP